jgi:hypothetical protein
MKTWLRLTIITMTVGGGFSGVALTSQVLVHSTVQWPNNLVIATFLALYAFVLVSGLLFVQNPRNTRLIIGALAIQIPCILSPIAVYRFASGGSIVLGIGTAQGTSGVKLDAGFGSNFAFELLKDRGWSFGVNLVALAILVVLLRAIRAPVPVLQPSSPALVEPTST